MISYDELLAEYKNIATQGSVSHLPTDCCHPSQNYDTSGGYCQCKSTPGDLSTLLEAGVEYLYSLSCSQVIDHLYAKPGSLQYSKLTIYIIERGI